MEVLQEVDASIPDYLPHDKVFPIRVGQKVFRISGASLLSDGPSYFTTFFSQPENETKQMFIDRNPEIFEKIYLHLQGYRIHIDNDYEFVYIWQDAHYFCLKRLQTLLREEPIIATIGNQTFKIPRLLIFSPGNCPNFFSVALESLASNGAKSSSLRPMIRPPPQGPICSANRLPLLFADLLELLWGNNLVIRNEPHRNLLIKECKYYRFLQLEQKLVKHKIIRNPFLETEEIVLNLTSLSKIGISYESKGDNDEQPVKYARPYLVKEPTRNLIFQIDSCQDSDSKLVLRKENEYAYLVVTNKIASKISQIFDSLGRDFRVESKKLVIPCILQESCVTINGAELKKNWFLDFFDCEDELADDVTGPSAKKRKGKTVGDYVDFKLTHSLWRIFSRADKLILQSVSLEAFSDQFNFNKNVELL